VSHFSRFLCVSFLLFALTAPYAFPCTTLLLPQSPDQILATNMDWNTPQGVIFINKRDVRKVSAFIPASQTPLAWTSQYMSLTFSQTGREFPWEGFNEKGLVVNVLELAKTQLPYPNSLPAVNGLQWIQYILDTSATLPEAVNNAQNARVFGSFSNTVQYFVCDAGGNCASFAYIFGTLSIHQGATLPYSVLANSGYQTSVNNLQTLLNSDTASEILALPGTDSLTRFAKAAMFSSQYTPSQNDTNYAFAALDSLRQNTTQWSMVFSLNQQTVQWKTTISPTIKSISLSQFDPHCSTPVMFFHVNSKLSGDVTSSFSIYTPADNEKIVLANTNYPASLIAAVEQYPDRTQCTEPSTALTSSPNPSAVGQGVVLTATPFRSGTGVPTGTITFQNGTTPLATVPLNSSGSAQLTTSSLPAGTNALTAMYSGDSADPPTTSFALNQVVAVPAQITLTSSQNPSSVGQAATFTATVTSASGTVPTGLVWFTFGTTLMASVPLVNGQATYTHSLNTSGTRSITATYSGDGYNLSSVSAPLLQVVY
jgi:penicillin V acylase-like amidase (Ntn superfamily)